MFCRKITDDIEKCEERLDILESEKQDKKEKLEHFEKLYNQAREAHEMNTDSLKIMESSGIF